METNTGIAKGTEARILIVEDDLALLSTLEGHYRRLFESQGYATVTVETAKTADEAKERARKALRRPYDFVSLDVNLGDTSVEKGRVLTGLDVLRVLKAHNSAWMVVLLTGVETDSTLDGTLGLSDAEAIRRKLRREAYQNFFPERLLVVEKPRQARVEADAPAATSELMNKLDQIVQVFQVVSQQRYVFRPVIVEGMVRVPVPQKEGKAKSKLVPAKVTRWQVRFNCGELLTVEGCKGFEIVHHLLGLDKTAEPVEAPFLNRLVSESDTVTNSQSEAEEDEVKCELNHALMAYFKPLGVNWEKLDNEQKLAQLQFIAPTIRRMRELMALEAESDISSNEEEELDRLVKNLGPLAEPLEDFLAGRAESPFEEAYPDDFDEMASLDASLGDGMQRDSGNFTKRPGSKRPDSPEAVKARKYLERVRDYLRKNGFPAFADHLQQQIMPLGTKWSYIPPSGIEWAV
ncbi:MAG: hypothetical protein SFY81_08310 [Verrucomicrobiota bacterium]|nr:hypothetical protein [Verrucomicrobiota bacterium]